MSTNPKTTEQTGTIRAIRKVGDGPQGFLIGLIGVIFIITAFLAPNPDDMSKEASLFFLIIFVLGILLTTVGQLFVSLIVRVGCIIDENNAERFRRLDSSTNSGE
ncbi:MAG: hypothetical protein M3N59_03125 [bacterium]|nr:hypothetical protein [bacterium]